MFQLIQQSGPFGQLICVLGLVNLALSGWVLASLLGSPGAGGARSLQGRINAILFWGAVGALAGLLGQASGLYLASRAVSVASEISPYIVMEGLAVSFLPTLMGFLLLLASALVWWGFRSLHARRVGFPVSV